MKLNPALTPLCAVFLTCALHAQSFEGKVTLSLTSSSSDAPQSMSLSLRDGFMRTDVASARGTMSAILDWKNQQMIILMPQQRMYMVQPLQQSPAMLAQAGAAAPGNLSAGPAPTLQETGVKETILGYDCTKYVSSAKDGTSEIWVTDQLGMFTGLFHGGGPGGRGAQAPQAWESALKGRNFFPMRVVTSRGGKGTFRLEVTAVQKGSLPDSLFAPPVGWRKIDMSGFTGGAMPGALPGAHPPSGNN